MFILIEFNYIFSYISLLRLVFKYFISFITGYYIFGIYYVAYVDTFTHFMALDLLLGQDRLNWFSFFLLRKMWFLYSTYWWLIKQTIMKLLSKLVAALKWIFQNRSGEGINI